MSEPTVTKVDIGVWIDSVAQDPVAHLQRQATEILLNTLGTTEPYCGRFLLKGGILMGIVYGSPRQTTDIDLTLTSNPNAEEVEKLVDKLNGAFPRVAVGLGYPDLMCRVQTKELRPKPANFEAAKAPSIALTIAYARRGSPQESRYQNGQCIDVLKVDISFNEPIGGIQVVRLSESDTSINAYSINDLIAEKFRAFLQQDDRKRDRRQDIYDLNYLLQHYTFSDTEKKDILVLLQQKCEARGITPKIDSMEKPTLIERAKKNWNSMQLELANLPDFDTCHNVAALFYRSLPWSDAEK